MLPSPISRSSRHLPATTDPSRAFACASWVGPPATAAEYQPIAGAARSRCYDGRVRPLVVSMVVLSLLGSATALAQDTGTGGDALEQEAIPPPPDATGAPPAYDAPV